MSCDNCQNSVKIPVGEKGDNGASAPPIIDATGATLTLTAAQTGSTILLDRASGVATALPDTPPIGTTFDFIVTTAVTSNAYSIDAGSAVYNGFVAAGKSATVPVITEPAALGNHTMSMNGSTTGGLVGTSFNMTYTTTGKWTVDGQTYGSGALATPFS